MRLSGWKILKIINKPSMLDEPPHVTPKLQFRSTAPIPPQGKHTMATEESVSALGNDYKGIKRGRTCCTSSAKFDTWTPRDLNPFRFLIELNRNVYHDYEEAKVTRRLRGTKKLGLSCLRSLVPAGGIEPPT